MKQKPLNVFYDVSFIFYDQKLVSKKASKERKLHKGGYNTRKYGM